MNLRCVRCVVLFCIPFGAGCGQLATEAPNVGTSRPGGENHAVVTSPGAAGFAPVRIGILPLTELTGSTGAGQSTTLHAFVTLLDAFGAQIKAPSVLRFELYEYVPRSAQAKGSQLFPGQNLDLTGAAENHRYWQDHLRAYEFELEAQVSRDKTYVLQVTCMTPNINGKRLSADYVLKNTP